mgnify:CR=1 FL=1
MDAVDDLERFVVLSVIWSPDMRRYMMDKVSSDVLSSWEGRYLYKAVYKFEKTGKPVNFISIQDYARRDHNLSDTRKKSIVDLLQPWLEVDERKESKLNAMVLGVTPRIEEMVNNVVIDRFLATSAQYRTNGECEKIWKLMDDAKREVGRFVKKQRSVLWQDEEHGNETAWERGIPLGINGTDSDTNTVYLDDELFYEGVGYGQMAAIQGDTGSGKSTMLLNVALYQSLSGYEVDYYSMEIISRYLQERARSILLGIPTFQLKTMDRKKVRKEVDAVLEKYPGRGDVEFYDEMPHKLTVSDIVLNVIDNRRRGRNVECVIIDYMDIMAKPRLFKEQYLELEYLSRDIISAAKEHEFAVVTVSQSNKPEEGKLSDRTKARGGYGKVFPADIWLPFSAEIVRNKPGDKLWRATIFYDKNRYGEGGTLIHLDIDYGSGKFFDVFPRRD